ncbi:MAG: type IV toxin-antitoxin system AbiEi family antitoxin domain-containing protein [Lachnospiraceae bacterium]|nr:type IV toxin-antitoxin system AbiEi family antitoxin domain-containing protein [Lachnospiraceae bacterium]
MLLNTYEKVTELFQGGNGYMSAAELRAAKVTTVQIKELVDKGVIEKISHGYYWLINEKKGKVENYEMLETCLVNHRAVICADSACYYHGLIKEKPKKLSVATLKTDRSKMQLNFPITRHYFSDLAFEQDLEEGEIAGGKIRVYSLARSVCDAIRFRNDIGKAVVDEIVKNFMKLENKELERLLAYADAMRVGKIVRTRLEESSK